MRFGAPATHDGILAGRGQEMAVDDALGVELRVHDIGKFAPQFSRRTGEANALDLPNGVSTKVAEDCGRICPAERPNSRSDSRMNPRPFPCISIGDGQRQSKGEDDSEV